MGRYKTRESHLPDTVGLQAPGDPPFPPPPAFLRGFQRHCKPIRHLQAGASSSSSSPSLWTHTIHKCEHDGCFGGGQSPPTAGTAALCRQSRPW